MYAGHTVAVVVPAYNEAGFVGDVIRSIPDFVDRVYVVDDASTDGTWREMMDAAAEVNDAPATVPESVADGGLTGPSTAHRDPRVVPLQHDRNQGVGAAIKTGYTRARADGIDLAAVMAGDGQMDPDRLEDVLDPLVDGRADYAKGNRLLDWDSVAGMTRFRLFGNVLLTLLTKIASGYWRIGDPQNGYTAVRLAVFDDVPLDDLYDEYGFANDLLVQLNAHDKRVADVPMPASYGDEESSIRYRTFITTVSLLLLRDFLWRLHSTYVVRDFHPLVCCYYGGATAGTLAIGALFLGALLGGTAGVGALLAAVVLGCFAAAGLLAAMYLDREHNSHLQVHATD